ncbi:hypothetical protein YW7DRAFT_00730 [Streptomyces sp. AmelKG-E11A]|nr:hypothetical protein YW7DRAFT_00730 [Streptomyces sp. AmelKG-E11A]
MLPHHGRSWGAGCPRAVPRAPGFPVLDELRPCAVVRGVGSSSRPWMLPHYGRFLGCGLPSRSSPRPWVSCAGRTSSLCRRSWVRSSSRPWGSPPGRTCSRAGTPGLRSSPRPFGGARLGLSSARGRVQTPLLADSRCCGRGWAGISARRLRRSSVGSPDVVPSVSDRGRRIPAGADPKNRPGAPRRGAGNCAKDEGGPAPEERPRGGSIQGRGELREPPSDGTGTSASRRTDLKSASEGDPLRRTSAVSRPAAPRTSRPGRPPARRPPRPRHHARR